MYDAHDVRVYGSDHPNARDMNKDERDHNTCPMKERLLSSLPTCPCLPSEGASGCQRELTLRCVWSIVLPGQPVETPIGHGAAEAEVSVSWSRQT
jgi:hypothetical protein